MKVHTSILRLTGVFLTIILILFCICSCQSCQAGELAPEKVPTKADLAIKYGIEESVIDDHHQKNPKIMGLPSEEDEFAVDRVIICVYQFAYQYDFAPEDFSEIPCESVKPFVGPYEESETPTRFLILELNTRSKGQLIQAVEILQKRADIYCADVDYVIHTA